MVSCSRPDMDYFYGRKACMHILLLCIFTCLIDHLSCSWYTSSPITINI